MEKLGALDTNQWTLARAEQMYQHVLHSYERALLHFVLYEIVIYFISNARCFHHMTIIDYSVALQKPLLRRFVASSIGLWNHFFLTRT